MFDVQHTYYHCVCIILLDETKPHYSLACIPSKCVMDAIEGPSYYRTNENTIIFKYNDDACSSIYFVHTLTHNMYVQICTFKTSS